ncbi:MAG: hypothetical protein V5A44_02925 [Haloarculaceae archaeon]
MSGEGPGEDGTGADGGAGDGGRGDPGDEPTRGSESAKWRCGWCGKPHSRNDPPCDNCGHHKFEKAVVPVAPESGDYERQPVWVCPECGREHQKNSPPCSRCGNANLEKHVPTEADYADELGGTSYLDVLEPQYVAGMVFALVAGGALVLALLGVITLPGMGGPSLSVADVPGNASTADGIDLAETERAYLANVNDGRAEAGVDRLDRSETLDDVARYLNQRRVKRTYTDDEVPPIDRTSDALNDACDGEQPVAYRDGPETRVNVSGYDSSGALAGAIDDVFLETEDATAEFPVGRTGLDVHVGPDGRVFVTQVVC